VGLEQLTLVLLLEKTITLVDVLFVPRFRKNLLSGGCLNTAGLGFGYFLMVCFV